MRGYPSKPEALFLVGSHFKAFSTNGEPAKKRITFLYTSTSKQTGEYTEK